MSSDHHHRRSRHYHVVDPAENRRRRSRDEEHRQQQQQQQQQQKPRRSSQSRSSREQGEIRSRRQSRSVSRLVAALTKEDSDDVTTSLETNHNNENNNSNNINDVNRRFRRDDSNRRSRSHPEDPPRREGTDEGVANSNRGGHRRGHHKSSEGGGHHRGHHNNKHGRRRGRSRDGDDEDDLRRRRSRSKDTKEEESGIQSTSVVLNIEDEQLEANTKELNSKMLRKSERKSRRRSPEKEAMPTKVDDGSVEATEDDFKPVKEITFYDEPAAREEGKGIGDAKALRASSKKHHRKHHHGNSNKYNKKTHYSSSDNAGLSAASVSTKATTTATIKFGDEDTTTEEEEEEEDKTKATKTAILMEKHRFLRSSSSSTDDVTSDVGTVSIEHNVKGSSRVIVMEDDDEDEDDVRHQCPVRGCPLRKRSDDQDERSRRKRKRKQNKDKYMCGKAEQALFSRSSSSSGTDSSLRIRKTRAGCTERRWFICVSLAMVFTVFVASAGIFFGYRFLRSHLPQTESVFRGRFRVQSGDYLPVGVAEVGSHVHNQKASFYQHKLDLVVTGSRLARSYLRSEVFLLEGHGEDGLTVHFNVHMDPSKGLVTPEDLHDVLKAQIINANESNSQEDESDADLSLVAAEREGDVEKASSVLGDLVIAEESLDIQERIPSLTAASSSSPPAVVFDSSPSSFDPSTSFSSSYDRSTVRNAVGDGQNELDAGQRECQPFQVDFCRQLPYNFTAFPNALGHRDVRDAKYDIERLKEIVDSKCYSLAYEFVCQLLQPVCFQGSLVLPCRDFCVEFLESCGNVLPLELSKKIDCGAMATEADGPGSCISKPGCVAEIRASGMGERVCDGVVDCPDFSDELYCQYCPEHHFHCGVGKTCVHKDKMCDGHIDCENAADEKGCLSLAPRMDYTSYIHQYYPKGYLVFQSGGEAGKVCADHMNRTVPKEEVGRVLEKLGSKMCSLLEYDELDTINIEEDKEENPEIRYVDMVGPMSRGSGGKSFVEVPCRDRQVISVSCSGGPACGRRPAHVPDEARDRDDDQGPAHARSAALHGDWPWQAALYRDGAHVCDGALVGADWVMTTRSCFQGQGRSRWAARLGSVRLDSRAPWEQRRRIVGMVKSPVEGNSLVILKLDRPVDLSDFARPVCLPSSDEFIFLKAPCITLGWDPKDNSMHVTHLETAPRELCEESSEVAANTICTQQKAEPEDHKCFDKGCALPSTDECFLDELAGAPLLCMASSEWHLVGVSPWRRACAGTASQRPRLYDRVSVAARWAKKTMEAMDREMEGGNKKLIKGNRIPKRREGSEKG